MHLLKLHDDIYDCEFGPRAGRTGQMKKVLFNWKGTMGRV